MDKEDVEYINTVDYYSAIKNEIWPFGTTWMHPEGIMLNEDRKRQILHDLPYTCNLRNKNKTKHVLLLGVSLSSERQRRGWWSPGAGRGGWSQGRRVVTRDSFQVQKQSVRGCNAQHATAAFPARVGAARGSGGVGGEDGCTADRASERHGGKEMQISGHRAED